MEERRFHREDYPLDILAEFGLTEEMIYDLPEFVHETLERGGKSPLLPICVEQPFGVTHAYAKFCLIETEEGLDVMFSPNSGPDAGRPLAFFPLSRSLTVPRSDEPPPDL